MVSAEFLHSQYERECELCFEFERLYKLDVLSISGPWTTAADRDAEGYVTTPSTTPLSCAGVVRSLI